MKIYPSIIGIGNRKVQIGKLCIAFYKYDGSNLRWEWSKKRGWYKYGTRYRLFDKTDKIFGCSIPIFQDTIGGYILEIVKDNYRNIERITAYTEFFGEHSFAGTHNPDDKKQLILFDVSIHKKGFISPKNFKTLFQNFGFSAKVVYEGNMNQEFIACVRNNVDNRYSEGVVCKGGSKHKLWMCKIKTIDYLRRLKDNKEFLEQGITP